MQTDSLKYEYPSEIYEDPKLDKKLFVKEEERIIEMFYKGLEDLDCKLPSLE